MTDRVPAELIAGDTWAWTVSLSEYPAGTWTATAYFEKRDGSFSAQASASGTDHAFSIAKATTAGYKPGAYRWRLAVDNGTVRYTLDQGSVTVLPDPAAAGSMDTRGHARRVLAAIEAYLEDANNLQASSMTIGGRTLARYTLPELLKLRDTYKAEVASENAVDRIAAGLGNPRRMYVRFDRG